MSETEHERDREGVREREREISTSVKLAKEEREKDGMERGVRETRVRGKDKDSEMSADGTPILGYEATSPSQQEG